MMVSFRSIRRKTDRVSADCIFQAGCRRLDVVNFGELQMYRAVDFIGASMAGVYTIMYKRRRDEAGLMPDNDA